MENITLFLWRKKKQINNNIYNNLVIFKPEMYVL